MPRTNLPSLLEVSGMASEPILQSLSEAAHVNPSLTKVVAPDQEVSFIPMADVTDTGRWTGRQTRTQREVSIGYTPFEEGDVLFAKITPCMENGKGCHAKGLLNGVGYGSTEFHVLRAKPGTNDRFLYFWSVTDEVRKKAEAFMIGSAGQQRVQSTFFDHFRIPQIDEGAQTLAARVLDATDEAIAKTEALIAKLKAIKQGLLDDLLTRGLDDNGELRDPEKHPEQFKQMHLGRFPIAWDVPTVNDLAVHVGSGITPTGGSNVYKREGILFIRSQNVTFEGLLLDDVAYIDERTHRMMARSEIFAHDVLLNITGASIGRCCAMPEGLGLANVNQHVCAIRIAEPRREDAVFLSAILGSYIGQNQIDRLNAGSNRQGLNYRQLRSFSVPWPKDSNERAALAARIESAESRIQAELGYLSKLKCINNGLMQDLLTGRVRVAVQAGAKET